MTNEHVSLYRATLAKRQRQYDLAIATNEYIPFLYPWDSLPALYLLLALAITPKLRPKLARAVRYIAFVSVLFHGVYVACYRRTLWFAAGYGIGLSGAWGVIMSGALLLCNDVGRDFRRLERRAVKTESADSEPDKLLATCQDVDTTNQRVATAYPFSNTEQIFPRPERPYREAYELVWQGFPYNSDKIHVLDWTLDLMTSFRAVGWGHRISTVGPIDPSTPRETFQPDSAAVVSNDQSRASSSTSQYPWSPQLKALRGFILSYLVLDFVKTVMITDPYFLGVASLESPTPWQWLAHINNTVPFATRFVRLGISMSGVVSALTLIFSLSPLFFASILPALVDVTKITKAPLLEPWMYPAYWQSLSTSVLYSGLAGLWGRCWHQMFRFGISEPSRVLIERLNMDVRGEAARIVQLLVAFTLSGSIHASASYTTFSLNGSRPFSGPLLFFFLQGIGILLQSFIVKSLHRHASGVKNLPSAVGQTVNALVVVLYLYSTGPLLANDFANSGLWLFEPVPISLFRGIGFGPGGKDEGWWTWNQKGSRTVGWWIGDRWWERAVAIY
ncbi:uncharacterized protein Z520_03924 [Fonsecaea multimorphosa CBS 102226]|uniref:Wax synthase domain-containing protein n=1 Tax=Fonsecaea multimorphosa CBS 102226 TaxID=1442371 RepID=A0A0D2KU02_9EURO|nr:uncharacterized protein Z520_03924 [Fonsecaea multimorphosa CBS 102226]KIY00239.1 hypothetical protein Z520_03924 [Fonsecaea multimorphosa CBS 102226]OAL27431.1 hypothetical protein AYO22_03706 [Fonsecaea multimorphosa]